MFVIDNSIFFDATQLFLVWACMQNM